MNKTLQDKVFVFSSVGSPLSRNHKLNVFKSWNLENFNSGCVIYGDDEFQYSSFFKTTIKKAGYKFPNFFYFDRIYNIVNKYKYICILDDDLYFQQTNIINETVNLMEQFNISLCSPSNNNDQKKSSYNVMASDKDEKKIIITNFCEMGCMVFKNVFLDLCKTQYYDKYPGLTDWGFDWFICSLANNYNYNIGIINHLSFSNPKQYNRNYGYDDWLNYKNNITYIKPKIHGTIYVKS